MEADWHKVSELSDLQNDGARIHAQLQGRYVSVLRHGIQLYCLDSVCFHAGGPLTLGEIEDLDSSVGPCLTCPWHNYQISINSGEKFYQKVEKDADGKLVAGAWKSIGPRQRVHAVEQREDGIYVKLNQEGTLASDEFAFKSECGERVKKGPVRLQPQHFLNPDDAAEPSPNSRLGLGRMSPTRRSNSPPPHSRPEAEDSWPADLVSPTRSSGSSPRDMRSPPSF